MVEYRIIIFQTSTSAQSRAIQAATHSKYSHMGMIYTVVKAKLQERYGNHIPVNQYVITPEQMFQSSQLKTVIQK